MAKSESSAMKIPTTIARCCNDPRRPRRSAGAISAMYAGTSTLAIPTPTPPITRQTTSSTSELAARPVDHRRVEAEEETADGGNRRHDRDPAAGNRGARLLCGVAGDGGIVVAHCASGAGLPAYTPVQSNPRRPANGYNFTPCAGSP
jgi:hypothetical protein